MGDGNNIIIIGNLPPQVLDPQGVPETPVAEETPQQHDPRENGSNLYNRQWQNSSASDLRSALFSMLSGGEMPTQHSGQTNNNSPTNYQNGQNPDVSNQRNPQNLLNQTLDELINSVKDSKDFAEFRSQPKDFWDKVRQMSDVRIVEKYVDGNLEPRAFSRYGELLEKFNRQGGQLNTFLNSLPPSEREVFQARYLLNQTLGADELFVGKGIVLDKNGQFAVRDFLANNGKNADVPLNTVLGFLGGKLSEDFSSSLFANGQLLLNSKTAALLSLSLALYQNINSMLPLKDALLEAIPQNLLGRANENGGMRFLENNLDGSKINIERRTGETLIAAAVINGALVTIDERDKFVNVSAKTWTGGETVFGNVFSAGATGAMLGAIIGCVVPLSETNLGTALGFAASVVVGTSERGLRYLSANLLISDVITNGVQTFLSATASLLLPEVPEPRNLLKQQLFNNRTLAHLTS